MRLGVFNRFLHSLRFWQVSGWRFHCLKSSLMVSNQRFFGRPVLLFPSISKSKICPVYSSLRFTCPNQRSLLHLNTKSRLFRFNRLRREFVLARCSFLMLHNHSSIALSLRSQTFLIFLSEGATFWWINHRPSDTAVIHFNWKYLCQSLFLIKSQTWDWYAVNARFTQGLLQLFFTLFC